MSSIISKLINLAGNITGVLPVVNGGTGVTTSTGSTNVVLSNSPTLVTPTLGAATATSLALSNTADSSTFAYYARATTASTFKFNGASGGTTGSLTIVTERIGDYVQVFIPTATVNVGTGTNTALISQTAVPAAYRPATVTQTIGFVPITNNGAALATPGQIEVNTSGFFIISRDAAGTAYTNSAVGGMNESCTLTYYVGTGS